MKNVAEAPLPDSPNTVEIKTRAEMLRAAIQSIPADQRNAVLAEVRDLIPKSVFERPKEPERGSELTKNVYLVFKNDPKTKRDAKGVVDVLERGGMKADIKPVRYSLNYLRNRQILRRVGYGLYQMEDGSIVEGPP